MKKGIFLTGVSLALISMVLLGCASLQVQKTAVTKANLAMVKGTWSGWTTFSSYQSNPVLTTVEIYNDAVPLQGKIVLNSLPDRVAASFPADAKTAGNDVTIDFKNGKISDQGTLIGQTGENFLELTLLVGEKTKMSGWFYYYGAKGTADFTKK